MQTHGAVRRCDDVGSTFCFIFDFLSFGLCLLQCVCVRPCCREQERVGRQPHCQCRLIFLRVWSKLAEEGQCGRHDSSSLTWTCASGEHRLVSGKSALGTYGRAAVGLNDEVTSKKKKKTVCKFQMESKKNRSKFSLNTGSVRHNCKLHSRKKVKSSIKILWCSIKQYMSQNTIKRLSGYMAVLMPQ